MNNPKDVIDQELARYLEREPHLNKEDKLKILSSIFSKCLNYEKALHLITEHDILIVEGLSKTAYGNLSLPLFVGERKMGYDDLRTIAHIEAMLAYLNGNYLNRKEIQINYKKF